MIVGCCRAVGAHHPQFELHLAGLAVAPAGQCEHATVGFLFSLLDGPGEAFAGIIGEALPARADDEIVNLHHAIRR